MIRMRALFQSLQIDRLENRWLARGLFLFVFAAFTASHLWPIGSSDISEIVNWVEKYNTANLTPASSQLALNELLSFGYLKFMISQFVISIVFLFISIYYSILLVGDRKDQKAAQSTVSYVKRLPHVILFVLLLLILLAIFLPVPMMIISSILPSGFSGLALIIVILYISSLLFLVPPLIIFEKMNPFDAVLHSVLFSKGYRFSFFWNVFTLFCLFMLFESIMRLFLPVGSQALYLVDGFSTAFIFMSVGRVIGIFYHLIRLQAP